MPRTNRTRLVPPPVLIGHASSLPPYPPRAPALRHERESPASRGDQGELTARAHTQAYALRALRLLFSLERNRKSFKRIFPPATFERFIEVGQYQRDLEAFAALTEEVAAPLAFSSVTLVTLEPFSRRPPTFDLLSR